MRDRNLRCGRGMDFFYLEVIQETHVGITERDLPLRCRIWDFQKTKTHEQRAEAPIAPDKKQKTIIPWKAQSNSRRNNGLNAVSFNFATSSTNAVIVALSTCGYNKTNINPQLPCVFKIRSLRTLEMSKSRRLSRRSSPSTKTLNAGRMCSRTAGRVAARRLRLSSSK